MCAFISLLLLSAATCTGSAQGDGTMTILDLIGENENFTIISGFFNNSSLNTTLAGEEPYTVFVPTDAAFENVSKSTLEALKEDPAARAFRPAPAGIPLAYRQPVRRPSRRDARPLGPEEPQPERESPRGVSPLASRKDRPGGIV